MSAQICSLSENWAPLWRLAMERRAPGGADVVRVRHGDGLGALERRGARHRRREVGVVQPRAVGPGERPVRARLGPEGQGRVAVGDQAGRVVVRQRADRPARGRAGGIGVTHGAEAAAGRQAGIGRLRPARPRRARDVDARDADARREGAVVVGPGVAGLHVDLVVGSGGDDVRVVGVDRDGRLVLLVLRERPERAPDADQGVLGGGGGGGGERDGGQEARGRDPAPEVLDHGALLAGWTMARLMYPPGRARTPGPAARVRGRR